MPGARAREAGMVLFCEVFVGRFVFRAHVRDPQRCRRMGGRSEAKLRMVLSMIWVSCGSCSGERRSVLSQIAASNGGGACVETCPWRG